MARPAWKSRIESRRRCDRRSSVTSLRPVTSNGPRTANRIPPSRWAPRFRGGLGPHPTVRTDRRSGRTEEASADRDRHRAARNQGPGANLGPAAGRGPRGGGRRIRPRGGRGRAALPRRRRDGGLLGIGLDRGRAVRRNVAHRDRALGDQRAVSGRRAWWPRLRRHWTRWQAAGSSWASVSGTPGLRPVRDARRPALRAVSETIQIIHALLRTGASTSRASTSLRGARSSCRAARGRTGPPIVIAARGPKMMQLTARYADGWNWWSAGPPDRDELRGMLDELDRHCVTVDRDPSQPASLAGPLLLDPLGVAPEPERSSRAGPDEIAASCCSLGSWGSTRSAAMVPGGLQPTGSAQSRLWPASWRLSTRTRRPADPPTGRWRTSRCRPRAWGIRRNRTCARNPGRGTSRRAGAAGWRRSRR